MGSTSALNEGAEPALPRSIRRGPLITITCKCGESRRLHYGERWTCEKCGRIWDTRKIPLEEYAQLRRTQLRYRRVPILISAISLICIVAFGLTAWSMFVHPFHKRRYREKLARLPTWDIEPE